MKKNLSAVLLGLSLCSIANTTFAENELVVFVQRGESVFEGATLIPPDTLSIPPNAIQSLLL